MCMKHYSRTKRHGSPQTVLREKRYGRTECSVAECVTVAQALGLCKKHWSRDRKYGSPLIVHAQMDHPETCAVDGCDRAYYAKGYCNMHWSRFRIHGDPLTVLPNGRVAAPTKERSLTPRRTDTLARRAVAVGDDCLPSDKLNTRGYGNHRAAYRKAKGEVPFGMHVDHLCRVRSCVNPDHLEVVTPSENLRRRDLAFWVSQAVGVEIYAHEWLIFFREHGIRATARDIEDAEMRKIMRPLKRCDIDECDKEADNGRICTMHRTRIWRHGDPNTVLKRGGPRKVN